MVSFQDFFRFPFLRALARARRSPRWDDLKKILRQNLVSGRPGAKGISFLASKRSFAQPPPLFQMAAGYWVSQAIYVSAKLGIGDALDSPKSCQQIAAITGANEDSLFRLLRVLCSLGICQEREGKYELTSHGQPLRSDSPGSLRSMILTLGEIHYQAWGNLLYSIKTGQPAFNELFGKNLFQHLSEDGEAGSTFHAAMTDFSGLASYAVSLAYDFSAIRTVVDVGGGHGKFLETILEMNSHLRGTVLDLPAVIDGTKQRLSKMNGRCTAVAGDFFTSVPSGADAYILSGVIHDWDDAPSIAILRNCCKAMDPHSRVLIIENMMAETTRPSFNPLLDLNVLVMCGGRERTESQFRALLHAAGLTMTRVVATLSPLKVIEAGKSAQNRTGTGRATS